MTGRGIDQILPHSVGPRLHERFVEDARTYAALAEAANGPLPRRVPYEYPWGDARAELDRVAPGVRIINLETALTTSIDYWRRKAVHYRMHPENAPLLGALGIDVCALGNNHVMDWGERGLLETIEVLGRAGVRTCGAGRDARTAAAPAVLSTSLGRLLVFSYGSPTAGVPLDWRAGEAAPGVNVLPDLGDRGAQAVIDDVERFRGAGDTVVVSLHWGANFGYAVPPAHRAFAHRLVDAGAADLIHGHSSHHPKGIEVHRGRLILHGCGDFLNDYEGIAGSGEFRGELTLMYFVTVDASGALRACEMTPFRMRRFRLERASDEEARWLTTTLDRASQAFGARVRRTDSGRLALEWGSGAA